MPGQSGKTGHGSPTGGRRGRPRSGRWSGTGAARAGRRRRRGALAPPPRPSPFFPADRAARSLRRPSSLLMRDLVALLDQQHVDQPGSARQQIEVLLPVPRRVGSVFFIWSGAASESVAVAPSGRRAGAARGFVRLGATASPRPRHGERYLLVLPALQPAAASTTIRLLTSAGAAGSRRARLLEVAPCRGGADETSDPAASRAWPDLPEDLGGEGRVGADDPLPRQVGHGAEHRPVSWRALRSFDDPDFGDLETLVRDPSHRARAGAPPRLDRDAGAPCR